jgi:hypothetical protein
MRPEKRNVPPREPSLDGRFANMRRPDSRTFGDLLSELTTETSTLVRQEIQLAKTELSEKATDVGKDAALITTGGAIAYAGLITLAFGLSLVLGLVMVTWLAFLIVGVCIAFSGYALLQLGLTRLERTNLALSKTAETLEEDKQWIKEEAKEIRHGRAKAETKKSQDTTR